MKCYIPHILFFVLCHLSFQFDSTDTAIPHGSDSLSLAPPCIYNPSLWLKANASASLSGGRVTTWSDQSGNANHVSQGSNSSRPFYQTNAINFNPALDFDGSNDFLQGNSGGSNTMLFMVARSDNTISNSSAGQVIITTDAQNPVSNAFFFSLGSVTAAFPNEVITYGIGNSTEYRRAQTGSATYATIPHLYTTNHIQATSSTTIHVNGARVGNNTVNTFINPENNRAYRIGGNLYVWGGVYFNGQIAEVLSFPTNLSSNDQEIIQSYLGIKYGISLAHAYKNGSGSTVWNEVNYPFNIGAIGRDDCFELNQKQTKNTNPGAILTIGLGTIAADNVSNANSFTNDQSYLFWGNDNDDDGTIEEITTELPTGIERRLDREWKIKNINNVGSTQMEFDLTGITTAATSSNDLFLLIDEDGDGDFTTGTVQKIAATSFSNNAVGFENIILSDGVVVTLATLPKANTPPAIKALTNTIEVCPNGVGILITSSIRVEDLEDDNLTAQITITGITSNEDVLQVDLTGYPLAAQSFTYPTLQITGTISPTNMEAILQTLSFGTTSIQAGIRNITIIVNDGTADSLPVNKAVQADENLAMCCQANAPLISK